MSLKRRLRSFGRGVAAVAVVLIALVIGAYLMIFLQSLVFG